ncbi:type III secretion system chaperone family protein [Georgenia sp.]
MAGSNGFDDRRHPPGATAAGPAAGATAVRDLALPLSRDRVVAALDELDYPWFTDRNGDLGAMWAQAVFHIYLLGVGGAVLQVRGAWHRRLALERLGEVLALVDRWNRDFIGPKCYVRVLDDGRLSVVAEVSTPLGTGVSDRQLLRLLQRGIGQGMRMMRDLEVHYPDPAGSAGDVP